MENDRYEAYANDVQELRTHKQTLARVLAKWMLCTNYASDYIWQAKLLHLYFSEDGIAAAKKVCKVYDKTTDEAAKEYMIRLVRNILAVHYFTHKLKLTKEGAQVITDYWTDTEILDQFSADSPKVQEMLRHILKHWQSDKDGGFLMPDASDEQRAAARAGNYGTFIERKLKAEESLQVQPESRGADSEKAKVEKAKAEKAKVEILSYFYSSANVDIERIAEALRKRSGIEAAAQLLGLWKEPKRVRSIYERGKNKPLIAFAKWLRDWRDAFDLKRMANYKRNQIERYLKDRI